MITLSAQKRTVTGRKVKALRKEGFVPAELFGPRTENQHLALPVKEFRRAFKEAGTSTVVELSIEGEKKPVQILIYDVHTHPITQEVLNVDCYHVHEDIKLHTDVPLIFTGISPAEKIGCIVVRVVDKLEVEALPKDIPHEITVDISRLEKGGDIIALKDLLIPPSVTVKADPKLVIAIVETQREEEVAPAAPAAAETAAPAPAEEAATDGNRSSTPKPA